MFQPFRSLWRSSIIIGMVLTACTNADAPLPTVQVLPSVEGTTATQALLATPLPPLATQTTAPLTQTNTMTTPAPISATANLTADTTSVAFDPLNTPRSSATLPVVPLPATPTALPWLVVATPFPTLTIPPTPTELFAGMRATPQPTLTLPNIATTVTPVVQLPNLANTNLGSNLSALQAYDAFRQTFSNQLTAFQLTSLIGNNTTGWAIELLNTNGTVASFLVSPDGKVSEIIHLLPLSVQNPIPLERDQIQIDSPQVLELLQSANLISANSTVVLRLVYEQDLLVWSIQDIDSGALFRVDARQGTLLSE